MWITGLPRAGKSSIAYGLEKLLFDQQHHVQVIDGEILRLGLSRDLGFSSADRWENQRRAAEIARLNLAQGISTIVALVAPMAFERDEARKIVGSAQFFEVFCDAPLATCEARDEDGLYTRARAGEIHNVTGVDAPYEPPKAAELRLDTATTALEDNLAHVVTFLRERKLVR